MTFMVARFDLDEAVRARNTPRATPKGSVLPVDFPFVIDDDTGEVPEPILLHLRDKFYSPRFRGRTWPRNSADAAAADLKAWWINLSQKGQDWGAATDRVLASYLTDMRIEVSPHTLDFLSDATFRRRTTSIIEFYKFAVPKWSLTTFPSIVNARLLAQPGSSQLSTAEVEGTDEEAHPIEDNDLVAIAEALGPCPTDRARQDSSRTRLAFELGVNVGLRIDEIVNLRASMFGRPTDDDPDGVMKLRITHTKGLNPRTVFVPNWLVDEIKFYIANEREECLEAARRNWLKGDQKVPAVLLLNQPNAGANAGKKVRPATIEMDFAIAIATLGLIRSPKVAAAGTEFEREVDRPKHVFHDARHTFALWTFEGFEARPRRANGTPKRFDDAIGFVQRRLGHKHRSTTTNIYLDVFNDLATEGVQHLVRHFRQRRLSVLEGRR